MEKGALANIPAENEEYRTAFSLHHECERKLSKMEKKTHLTGSEEVERKRLKKLKLVMKDKMEKIFFLER